MSKKEKSDLRVGRTKRALQNALQALMQKKCYERITVREIVTLAEVARPTFYVYFATKDHLLASLYSEVLDSIQEELLNDIRQGRFDRHDFATRVFKLWGEHAQLFRLIYDAGADQILLAHIQQIVINCTVELRVVEDDKEDLFKPYVDDVVAGSLSMALKRWIQEDMPLPAEALGQFFGDMWYVARSTVPD